MHVQCSAVSSGEPTLKTFFLKEVSKKERDTVLFVSFCSADPEQLGVDLSCYKYRGSAVPPHAGCHLILNKPGWFISLSSCSTSKASAEAATRTTGRRRAQKDLILLQVGKQKLCRA